MIPRRSLRFLISAAALVALLAACYVPDHFKSEVRLSANGDYSLEFIGDLIWEPFNVEIQQGKHTPKEIADENAVLARDLGRDSGFKEVKPLGNARFHVRYERQGHLGPSDEVSFIRRDQSEQIIEISATPTGRISINGRMLSPSQAQQLTTAGITTEGEFDIITDGLVLETNANSKKQVGRYVRYLWVMKDAFSPPPHFVMQREGVFPKK